MAGIFICLISFTQNKTNTSKPTGGTAQSTVKKKQDQMVEIITDFGNMVVKLYDSTPLHRDNFIKLVKEGFYDSLMFHRVIPGFMIQGGDPNSRNAPDSVMLGAGSAPGGMIKAEIRPYLIHKKGALAAARPDNPQKASNNCQFYIVQGEILNDVQLNMAECQVRSSNPAFTYSDAQRNLYKTTGGAPLLDQNYTVFGEVIEGIEVIDKIIAVPRDANNRPLKNVRMKMKLLN